MSRHQLIAAGLLTACACACATAATAPPAGARVYWSEQGPQPGPGQAGPSYIKAGNGLGGPAPLVQTVVSGNANIKGPNGVEALDGRLWWPDQQLGVIATTLPDGSGRLTIGVSNPYDMDLEGGQLYITTLNDGRILRVADPLGAPSAPEPVLSGLSSPFAVDAAGGYLYWSEVSSSNRLRRSNLDGSGIVTLVSAVQSYDFQVTPQYIYLSTTAGEVLRTNLDGSGLTTLASGIGFLNGIEVTADRIYVSSFFGQVSVMGLGGESPTVIYDLPGGPLRGVAVMAAVPEPAGWMLMFVGLAVAGARAQRQRGKP